MNTDRVDHILYNLEAGAESLKHEVADAGKLPAEVVQRIAKLAASLSTVARAGMEDKK